MPRTKQQHSGCYSSTYLLRKQFCIVVCPLKNKFLRSVIHRHSTELKENQELLKKMTVKFN